MSTPLTVLITGANRGIGLALAQLYHHKGWQVLATARHPSDAHELHKVAKQIYELDVASDASIEALGRSLAGQKIDLLINNAGIFETRTLGDLTRESALREISTNALGPILVSRTLLPQLRHAPQPHIVNMTSRMGSIDDNTSGGCYGYRASKCALNQMTKSWSIDVRDVPAIAVHPGYIQTGMTGGNGDMSAENCAISLIKLFDDFTAPNSTIKSGSFLHRDGHALPF